MILKIFFLFFSLNILLLNGGCTNNNFVDKKYSNVFKPLDGTWQGKFYIYEDTLGQKQGKTQPEDISEKYLKSLSLKLVSVIEAKHVYKSVNPFLQIGEITDIYIDSNGERKEEKSTAVNSIENGKLKCVVNKPDETVIHKGKYLGNNTIVWHRDIKSPKRIEYFKETVDNLHYKIIGWGYYGKDNSDLTPRTWFYADYLKVK